MLAGLHPRSLGPSWKCLLIISVHAHSFLCLPPSLLEGTRFLHVQSKMEILGDDVREAALK